MFSTIVVPIDGSEPSDAAVRLALQLASENKAEIIFVHAVELNKVAAMAGPGPIDPSYALEAACAGGKALLAEAKQAADAAGVKATTEQPEDSCVPSVLEIARQKKADLIVLGSHGRTGIPRLLLGSVTEGIMRQSPIPVLVCHAPERSADPSPTKNLPRTAETTIL